MNGKNFTFAFNLRSQNVLYSLKGFLEILGLRKLLSQISCQSALAVELF